MKKIINGFVIAMLAIVSLSVSGQGVGDPAPDFTVDLVDGGTFTLSNHNDKVVMIYFFGNACPFCVEAGPLVQGIYNSFKDESDFVAVGLDTWDSSSDVESVTDFRNAVGITFPLGLKANFVKIAYNYTYDRIVVIDKSGIIRRKANTPAINDIDASSNVIQDLLNSETITSVENVTEQKSVISLYPLPASNVINADFYLENSSEVQFVITDIAGKTRKRLSYNLETGNQHVAVDIDGLEQGLYFYSVQLDGRVESGKMIIQ